MPPRLRVLFVCLGNICRSPTAEVVFRDTATRAGLKGLAVDSAGTGEWHVGNPPDWRAIEHARRRGYELAHLRARQVGRRDFADFDYVFAMDRSNLAVLTALRPADCTGHLGLFLDGAPELAMRDVPDPYDGGPEAFERMLDLIEAASRAWVRTLAPRLT
ncbi:MAG: low molecular weight protein-tyrosine-phosphatase [Burkholderiales bacterium]